MSDQPIPDGYLQNAAGHLVPISKIKEIDIIRNELVNDIVKSAKKLQQIMANFKTDSEGDIESFIELSAEQYNVNFGGKKGNVTLSNYDASHQIKIQISDQIVFDERLQIAKELVDQCIHRWTANSNDNIKALVEHAFQTDKEGKINTARVINLTRLKIDDPQWLEAMEALRDSMQVASSKSYMRVYERDEKGKYHAITLDIAGL